MAIDWQHTAEVYGAVAFLSFFLWTEEHKWIIAVMCASFLVFDFVFPVCLPETPPPPETQGSVTIQNLDTPPNSLTRDHLDPIASRKWKTVRAWIAKKKQTILHHACLFRAPAILIEIILYAAPELASLRNEDGETALHWAIRLSAPNEIIKMLLAANPTSGTHARDKDGNTPLSLLWDRHREEFSEALEMNGGKGVLYLNSWKRILLMLQYNNNNQGFRDTSTGEDIDNIDAKAEAETPLPFRPLHVTAQISCPPGLVPLLITVYRNELEVKDEDGRLPLHVAAANATTNRSYDVQSKISMMLTEYPEAARVADASGRLPIYIALESGTAWDEGIQDLFALEPKVIGNRDCVTSLYPFMLGAVGAGRRWPVTTDVVEIHECQLDYSLSTIYTLLRAEPTTVCSLTPVIQLYECFLTTIK
jgi:ankyrin repeat protein